MFLSTAKILGSTLWAKYLKSKKYLDLKILTIILIYFYITIIRMSKFWSLAIVDMQDEFLGNAFNATGRWFQIIIDRLIVNVVAQITKTLSEWWKVIIIEYANHWRTNEKIERVLSEYGESRVIRCSKRKQGLLTDCRDSRINLPIFQEAQEKWILMCWIHTSSCVLSSSRDLDINNIQHSIWAGLTMNLHPGYDLWHLNDTREVFSVYWSSSSNLLWGGIKQPSEDLDDEDYLFSYVNNFSVF